RRQRELRQERDDDRRFFAAKLPVDGMDAEESVQWPPLVAHFCHQAGSALRTVRRRSGLSPQGVAELSGIPVEVVERAEVGDLESMTLQHYFDLALVCGYLPLDLVLEPVNDIYAFALEEEQRPRTPTEMETWHARRGV